MTSRQPSFLNWQVDNDNISVELDEVCPTMIEEMTDSDPLEPDGIHHGRADPSPSPSQTDDMHRMRAGSILPSILNKLNSVAIPPFEDEATT